MVVCNWSSTPHEPGGCRPSDDPRPAALSPAQPAEPREIPKGPGRGRVFFEPQDPAEQLPNNPLVWPQKQLGKEGAGAAPGGKIRKVEIGMWSDPAWETIARNAAAEAGETCGCGIGQPHSNAEHRAAVVPAQVSPEIAAARAEGWAACQYRYEQFGAAAVPEAGARDGEALRLLALCMRRWTEVATAIDESPLRVNIRARALSSPSGDARERLESASQEGGKTNVLDDHVPGGAAGPVGADGGDAPSLGAAGAASIVSDGRDQHSPTGLDGAGRNAAGLFDRVRDADRRGDVREAQAPAAAPSGDARPDRYVEGWLACREKAANEARLHGDGLSGEELAEAILDLPAPSGSGEQAATSDTLRVELRRLAGEFATEGSRYERARNVSGAAQMRRVSNLLYALEQSGTAVVFTPVPGDEPEPSEVQRALARLVAAVTGSPGAKETADAVNAARAALPASLSAGQKERPFISEAQFREVIAQGREQITGLRAEVLRLTEERDDAREAHQLTASVLVTTDARAATAEASAKALREALEEVARRTAVGPPLPPRTPPHAGDAWYDRLLMVSAFAKRASALAPPNPSAEKLTPTVAPEPLAGQKEGP